MSIATQGRGRKRTADSEAQMHDALEAWVEMGNLSNDICRGVLSNILARANKHQRLEKKMEDSAAASRTAIDGRKEKSSPAAACMDLLQKIQQMNKSVALFFYAHESLRRDMEAILECNQETEETAAACE